MWFIVGYPSLILSFQDKNYNYAVKLLRARKPLGYGDLLDLFQVCESVSFDLTVIKFGNKIHLSNSVILLKESCLLRDLGKRKKSFFFLSPKESVFIF